METWCQPDSRPPPATSFVSQLGPIPHLPETGKIVAGDPRTAPHEVASGASMLIDVERGPRGVLYALSQGQWDGVGEGSRTRAAC